MRNVAKCGLLGSATLCIALVATGCTSTPPTGGDPGQPEAAIASYPLPDAEFEPTTLTLRWTATDPDNDPLIFDLYFGTGDKPELLAEGLAATEWYLTGLTPGTEYCWRVDAIDPDGHSTRSRQWTFQTRDGFSYPMQVGNHWAYSGKFEEFDFKPAEGGQHTLVSTAYTSEVDVASRQYWPGLGDVFELTETLTEPWGSLSAADYYADWSEGLYRVAYDCCGKSAPRVAKATFAYHLAGRTFSSRSELISFLTTGSELQPGVSAAIVTLEDPPVPTLQYPLKAGSRWQFRADEEPFRIDKAVVGRAQVDVPAGQFDCFVVQWTYPANQSLDDQVEFYDYIAAEGLIKRSVISRDIRVTTYSDPYGLMGTVDLRDEFVLMSYQVQ